MAKLTLSYVFKAVREDAQLLRFALKIGVSFDFIPGSHDLIFVLICNSLIAQHCREGNVSS